MCKRLLLSSVLLAVLAGCGASESVPPASNDNPVVQTADKAVAADNAPAANAPRIKNGAGVEYIVSSDNTAAIENYKKQQPFAKVYLEKLDREVERIMDMAKSTQDSAAIAEQSKRMREIKGDGEVFGAVFQPNSPLAQCRSAGIEAAKFWDVMAGFITTEKPEEALASYKKVAGYCRDAMAEKPVPEMTLLGPTDVTAPPYPGCLTVISAENKPKYKQWTCPAGAVKS